MPQSELLYEIFLRGLTAGLALAAAFAFLRGKVSREVRIAALLACVSAVGYWLTMSQLFAFAGEPFRGFEGVARLVGIPLVGFVWLFLAAIFDDRRVTAWTLAPAGLLMLLYLLEGVPLRIAAYHGLELSGYPYYAAIVFMGLLAAHALYFIVKGWRGDLVEARRRLRGPLTAVAVALCLYLLWLMAADVFVAIVRGPLPGRTFNLAAETLIALAAMGVLLEARSSLFGATPVRAPDTRSETADLTALGKLKSLMEAGEIWRREGLGIAALAAEIGVGEQRLRRLINRRLGHRNFNAFINAYRIEAAKARLASTEETVAQIAFDLGFASLGPFNRAFKDAEGKTPTEWRRQARTMAEAAE